MKITYPHSTAPEHFVRGSIEESIYVVLCRFQCGHWGIASFFSLPYADRHYLATVAMKTEIYKEARKYGGTWIKDAFKVAKITL